jgi:hypothetical protein
MSRYSDLAKAANNADKPQQDEHRKEEQKEPGTISRYHDINNDIVLGKPTELIRRAVKQVGKETTNYRLTSEEKDAVADLVYAFKKRGIRTSENEIVRIAINNLMNDYQENGDNSVLVTVLTSLNS